MILYTDAFFPAALGHTSTDATLNDKNTRFAPQPRRDWKELGKTDAFILQHKLPQEESNKDGRNDHKQRGE